MVLRPSSDRGVLHRESRPYDHRDDVPRPGIQRRQGRTFESQHAGPLPVGGWRSPHRREALLEPFGSRGFLGDIRSRNRGLRRSADCVLSRRTIALRIRHDALVAPLHALLLNHGLPDQPISLIEPHSKLPRYLANKIRLRRFRTVVDGRATSLATGNKSSWDRRGRIGWRNQ